MKKFKIKNIKITIPRIFNHALIIFMFFVWIYARNQTYETCLLKCLLVEVNEQLLPKKQ
jgi:hypothetical protein